MEFRTVCIAALALTCPTIVFAAEVSSILPVKTGSYAPAKAGCETAMASFIYVEANGLGANKTTGKVRKVSRDGKAYVLDVLWVEAGSTDADGDRDTVRIEVKDDHTFFFSNTTSDKTLMRWCN